MRTCVRLALGLAIAAAAAGPVKAGPLYWDFSFTGTGVTGEGTLVMDGTPDPSAPAAGGYDIIAITGIVNGDAITGLLGGTGPMELSPDGFFDYDNVFYPAGAASAAGGYFDDDGLLFTTAGANYNLFYDGTTYWDWTDQGSGIAVTFTATDPPSPPISEPASIIVLGSALIGWMLVRRRKSGPPSA
jgi:hypothetical protein